MHGGMRYPQVFGRILAESPALWLADLQMLNDLKTHKGEFPQRLYMGMGTVEYSSRADIGPESLEVDALLVEWVRAHSVCEACCNTQETCLVALFNTLN